MRIECDKVITTDDLMRNIYVARPNIDRHGRIHKKLVSQVYIPAILTQYICSKALEL